MKPFTNGCYFGTGRHCACVAGINIAVNGAEIPMWTSVIAFIITAGRAHRTCWRETRIPPRGSG